MTVDTNGSDEIQHGHKAVRPLQQEIPYTVTLGHEESQSAICKSETVLSAGTRTTSCIAPSLFRPGPIVCLRPRG